MDVLKIIFLLLLAPVMSFCTGCNNKNQSFSSMTNKMARNSITEQYPKMPHEELLREAASGSALYGELKNRYAQSLIQLQQAVQQDGAKLIVVIMTPETGKFDDAGNAYGIPYITETCTNLGIDCVDYTPDISEWMEADVKRAPVEGNFTKEGAAFMAGLLASVLEKYDDYRSPKIFPAGPKPETFGDIVSKRDEVIDGEKNIPYHLTANTQGLRMDHNLTFPKTKQTILFLGDAKIFNPYLDNEDIITELLQRKYPGKEIVNAGNLMYTMDDYHTLYVEKARYVQPDIVIVCTNGGDILDNFFSQRNRYSRSGMSYKPSELEKKFYKQLSK